MFRTEKLESICEEKVGSIGEESWKLREENVGCL
jgi:hypothetical protein